MFNIDMLYDETYKNMIINKFVKPLNFTNREMFPGDWIRYRQAIEMLDRVDLLLDAGSIVVDLGSPLPFITYYTSLKYGSHIFCRDISINQPYHLENVRGGHFNVCKDDIVEDKSLVQECDFISFTEVLEHLPCNMYLVREKVISSLKDGKYLFISYPLGGYNASTKEYGKDLLNEDWNTTHTHLREFTPELAKSFISNLKIVDVQKVVAPSYKAGSMQILYKKEFV